MISIQFVLLCLAAYLFGSVPASYIVVKIMRGADIRFYGSGNTGASNLLKLVPVWAALPALVYDISKGAVPVYLAGLTGAGFVGQVMAGLAAVAGHNWSVFLGFNGGRGVATAFGMTLVLVPKLALLLASVVLITIPFHQTALFTLIAAASLPVSAYFSGTPAAGWLVGQTFSGEERLSAALALSTVFIILVIRRLTAPRSELAAGVRPVALFWNRLLNDRDTRERDVWVNRNVK